MVAAYIITYLNDEHVERIAQRKDFLNLYIDVRSVTPNFFDEKQMKMIINDPESMEVYIVQSIYNFLKFVNYHISLAFKFNLWPRFFFFCDIGESVFHKQINKDYKANRGSPIILSEDEYKRAKNLVNGFLQSIKRYFMEVPFLYYIFLEFIETDFIPYYIMKKFNFTDKDVHVIMSRDKDLAQCLDVRDDAYQFFLDSRSGKTLLSEDDAVKFHFKTDIEGLKPRWIPLILSIAGDASDNVIGIKGIGYKRAVKILDEYKDILENNNFKNVDLICENQDKVSKSTQKLVKSIEENRDLVVTNLKLTDFDYLVENLPSIHVEKINKILKHKWDKRDFNDFISQINEVANTTVNFPGIRMLFESYNSLIGV